MEGGWCNAVCSSSSAPKSWFTSCKPVSPVTAQTVETVVAVNLYLE
jgi:hypothetical protein